MMPNWTKQQEQAIRARNHTILVSAAASAISASRLRIRLSNLIMDSESPFLWNFLCGFVQYCGQKQPRSGGNAPALGEANQPRGYQP